MPKYRVTFETEVQVDGWSDCRDREYELRRETVTVIAKNLKMAKRVSRRQAYGYCVPAYWGHPTNHNWTEDQIKRITRIPKRNSG